MNVIHIKIIFRVKYNDNCYDSKDKNDFNLSCLLTTISFKYNFIISLPRFIL